MVTQDRVKLSRVCELTLEERLQSRQGYPLGKVTLALQ